MSLYDRLTIKAAKSIGINPTFSNNSGEWSRDNADCLELACRHKLDLNTSQLGLRKARLEIVLKSARINPLTINT